MRPSGIVVSGSLLSVLRPLLTSAPARRPLLGAAPDVAAGLGGQISLSKDANFPCAAAPFTSGTEHRTSLCWASLSAPSALYGISVRRLIRFEVGFLPTGPRDPAVALLYRLRHPAAHAGQPDDGVPACGDFHPASSRPCQAHPAGSRQRRDRASVNLLPLGRRA